MRLMGFSGCLVRGIALLLLAGSIASADNEFVMRVEKVGGLYHKGNEGSFGTYLKVAAGSSEKLSCKVAYSQAETEFMMGMVREESFSHPMVSPLIWCEGFPAKFQSDIGDLRLGWASSVLQGEKSTAIEVTKAKQVIDYLAVQKHPQARFILAECLYGRANDPLSFGACDEIGRARYTRNPKKAMDLYTSLIPVGHVGAMKALAIIRLKEGRNAEALFLSYLQATCDFGNTEFLHRTREQIWKKEGQGLEKVVEQARRLLVQHITSKPKYCWNRFGNYNS